MNSPSAAPDWRGDYFTNHARAHRWPFTLYHRPIEKDLVRVLAKARGVTGAPRALVFGCGLFHESPLFAAFSEITLVDVDRRLEPFLQARFGHRAGLSWAFPQSSGELASVMAPASVDVVVSKEVIEHLDDAREYLSVLRGGLVEGGRIWLSTPNYGAPILPLVESTFLELVARMQGFSRRGIHPNKYSRRRLARELTEVGFSNVEVRETPFRLALCATGTRV